MWVHIQKKRYCRIFLFFCLLAVISIAPVDVHALGLQFVWTPNEEPVSGYKLYYKIGDNAADPFVGTGFSEGNSPIDVGNASSFLISNVSENETYQFALTSYNEVGESEFSEIVTIRPDSSEPPTFDVAFTWTPNEGPIAGYKLYYKRGGDDGEPFDGTGLSQGDSPIIVGNTSSFLVTGLSANDTYHFALTAFNEAGESGYSGVITFSSEPVPVIINIRKN